MSAIGFAPLDMVVLGLTGFLVGMRRGGIQGAAVIAVTILASRFTAAASVGIAVVIFLYADVQATIILVKDVDWRLLGRLLVPTIIGIGVAVPVGRLLTGPVFEWVLFGIILVAYASLIAQRVSASRRNERRGSSSFVTLTAGFLSGFTSMIGNLASIFIVIYFSDAGSRKEQFIATSVWFFFVVNLIKLPIHIWVWRTLSLEMVVRTLILIPIVTLGILAGRVLTSALKEETYWRFVVGMAGLGVVRYAAGLTGLV